MSLDIKVIDGGLSTILERKNLLQKNDPLWTARLLRTNPSSIVDVHKSYLDSGSDIITTASYQATVSGFQKHLKLTEKESLDLIKSSVDLAKQARKEYLQTNNKTKKILIAGSVGPYGAYLADGSEYSGNYCDKMTHEELKEWHRSRIQCLVDAGVDLLALETIPALKEGEALVQLLHDFPDMKAWLSFSCQSPHETAHKELIGIAALNCVKISLPNQIIAVGVNCCKPSNAFDLLKNISDHLPNYPLITYPNSGETWSNKDGWNDVKDKEITAFLKNWISLPLKFVGGCCRTGPEDIAEIIQCLKNS